MTEPLRIVFAGTPEFAAEHLKALLSSPYEIVAVYTQRIVRPVAGKN